MKLVVYGAGGLGKEVLRIVLECCGRPEDTGWQIAGFIDDVCAPGKVVMDGYRVLGPLDFLLQDTEPTAVVFGFSSVEGKIDAADKLKNRKNLFYPNFVHPSSVVYPTARFEEGIVVAPFCFVSERAVLGRFVFLNAGTQIGHDSIVGDYCSLMPSVNISGNVSIGNGSFLGVKSTVLEGIQVGRNVKVDAASLVYRDVEDACTVCGIPARVIARRDPSK